MHAIAGNTDDKYMPQHGLPRRRSLKLGGLHLHLHHGDQMDDEAALRAFRSSGGEDWPSDGKESGQHMIISGHSHTPSLRRDGGVLFLNPGSAGPPRFGRPASGNRCALVRFSEVDGSCDVRSVSFSTGAILTEPWSPVEEEGAPPSAKKRRTGSIIASMAPAPGSGSSVKIGTVRALFCNAPSAQAAEPFDTLTFIKFEGIAGDRHASPLSPRQVMLACACGDASTLPPGAMAENVLVDVGTARCATVWPLESGSVVEIGEQVRLRITFAREPCASGASLAGVAFSVFAPGGPKEVLKTASRGMMATVLQGGVAHLGDEVRTNGDIAYHPLSSENVQSRLAYIVPLVLRRCPKGRVVTYHQLASWAGAKPPNLYVRRLPELVKQALADGLPAHRVVDSNRRCIMKHLPNQVDELTAEGVGLVAAAPQQYTVPPTAVWEPQHEDLFLQPPE